MAKYFILDCDSPLEAVFYQIEVKYPVECLRWRSGILFSKENKRSDFVSPEEPIELSVEPEDEPPLRIYPELTSNPIPLMSRRLVAALREAGVKNLQTFETVLNDVQGKNPPPNDFYLAVNIFELVSAADLKKSKTNPEVQEKRISMDFFSLSIDEEKASGHLMFRLAENVSAVLVHEKVKEYVESKGINNLTWYKPEEWAG
jgi:hypothetical protein